MNVGRLPMRDLWIDGRCYRVEHPVWAHVAFLLQLATDNAILAERYRAERDKMAGGQGRAA